jgi:hypothetical protein
MPHSARLFQNHAARLFVPADESAATDTFGLPIRPDRWHQPPQRGREHWNDSPCVVLLGEPGSGKSREFESWRDELCQAGQPAFLIALYEFTPNRNLARLAGPDGEALGSELADSSTVPVTLFLDALDEGRLRFPDVLRDLVDKLEDTPRDRPLRLRLSCRSRDWRTALDRNDLRRLFPDREGQPGIAVVDILPLDLGAIRSLAGERLGETGRVNAFVDAALERDVLPLAGHPFTLGMMLEVFEKDEKLGDSRTAIFDRACTLLVRERNPVHAEQGKRLTTPEERLRQARHLAALGVLSNRAEIHIPDTDEATAQALSGTLVVPEKEQIREILDTSLFRQSLPGSFQFLHPLLADFLAALWVTERLADGLRPRALLPLLRGGEAGVPSPLRNFAAWLAAFDQRICAELLRFDPVTLVRGDVGRLSADDRIALVKTLASRYAEREFQREVDGFGDLACGLSAEIFEELIDSVNSLAVRRMALSMCLAAKRADMAAVVWRIVANPKENQGLREQAVELICELAPSEYSLQLVALLDCPSEEDPTDEIAGSILRGLYPQHLNTEQALSALRAPRKESFLGNFRYFWGYEFIARLPESDEMPVLDSLIQQVTSSEEFCIGDVRPKLYYELLICQLKKLSIDDISRLLKWLKPLTIDDQMGVHYDSGELIGNIHGLITAKPEIKRALIEYDIELFSPETSYEAWRTPFPSECLQPDDFEWMASLCDRDSLRGDVRLNLYRKLERIYTQGHYVPTNRLDCLMGWS